VTQSKFGYNVLDIENWDIFITHCRELNPTSMLFYSYQMDKAKAFKAIFPNCVVIIRDWPDDGIHDRETPQQWLDKRQHLAEGGFYLYTTNEPGFGPGLVTWTLNLMKLCEAKQIRLCVLNFSVGRPEATDWKAMDAILREASLHRELFIIGLHEYAGGVITSGLYGGNPDQAYISATEKRDLTKVTNWPTDVTNITCFHMGRFKFLVEYCKSINLTLPRIIITEWGFDYTGDIGKWLDNLVKTDGHKDINGWKTLVKQWSIWFKEWTSGEEAYYFQAKWAELALYKKVEGILIFAWTRDSQWGNFDVSQAKTFQSKLAETTTPVTPPTDTVPTPDPSPTTPLPGFNYPTPFPELPTNPIQAVVIVLKWLSKLLTYLADKVSSGE